jgi:hypothetical protein
MNTPSIDLELATDLSVIDIPKLAELQMELRALKRLPSWREIRSATFGSLAPAMVMGNFLARRAATSSAMDYVACSLMVLLPLIAIVIFLERRSRQIRLMESMLHCLAEQQNEHRRLLARLSCATAL